MPSVVVDTSVSLPATLSPGGARRKLWVVLAFGALTHEVEHGRLELDALGAQADQEGGSHTTRQTTGSQSARVRSSTSTSGS